MTATTLCLIICSLFLSISLSLDNPLPNHTTPLYRFTVTDSGFSSVLAAMKDTLISVFMTAAMPEISDTIHLSGLGNVSFDINNIIFSSVEIHSIEGDINVDEEELFGDVDLDVSASFTWSWQQQDYPHLSDQGSAEASLEGVYLAVTAELLRDPVHYICSFNCSSISILVDSFAVAMHGELEFLYDLFFALFEDQITQVIELLGIQFVEDEIVHFISREQELHNLDGDVTIDERMTSSAASWGDHFFYVDTYGDIYPRDAPGIALSQPVASMPAIQTDHGFQVFMDVGQWRENLQAHNLRNAFEGTVTQSDDRVPESLKTLFDASTIAAVVPELWAYEGDTFQYSIFTTDIPTADVFPVALLITANLTVCIQLEGSTNDILCIKAPVSVTSQLIPTVARGATSGINRIGTNSTFYGLGSLEITHSAVGTVKITHDLQMLFSLLVQDAAPFQLDYVMRNGGPIYPMGFLGVDLSGVVVVYSDNYILLASDLVAK
eukprot:gnl/Dysnectes_brevis/1120_a1251_2081.p2 GENE.gnl/Dysnectes_brevis/1120_a1251_2081~~gnl/Dysnectes_brevis/1120_a1251_2081.p2  ORF type:complete len:494 (-),score=112.25 gnl/Dysnectes_brevis/1120_a1251_2081:770-2251(-)